MQLKDRDGVWNFTSDLAINIALGPSPSFHLYLKHLWTDIFQPCSFDAGQGGDGLRLALRSRAVRSF